VPRVWEKIEEKLREVGKKNTGIKKTIADWAKAAALEHHTARMAGKEGPTSTIIYNLIITSNKEVY
jgi:long-chain-fatty-acid--CoA ligase ACSBG